VSITSPSTGATVSGTVSFTAQAASNVVWLNFYVDGSYVWSSPPYTYNWNSGDWGSGSHTLAVKAYNGNGSQIDQASIGVNVGSAPSSSSSSGSGPSYFSLQTVGASLPSAAQCAQWVLSQGGTELQPSNQTANQTTPTSSELSSFHSNPTFIGVCRPPTTQTSTATSLVLPNRSFDG
jgi:Bacterial Ig domain